MKSRSYTVSVGSNTVWEYKALEDSNERPRLVTFNNTGDVAVYAKWMNVKEGNGNVLDKFYLAPGTSKTVNVVSSELPIVRVGLLLFAATAASIVVISTANFEPEN